MALPKQSTPVYTTKIPSTKKEFKFRPFLVKEQKALMIAQQSEDLTIMTDTLKSVISQCSETKVDVDNLAIFDLEYIFSQIRAKSVGEKVELLFPCDVCEDEAAKKLIGIDLTELKVDFKEGHSQKIELFDDVGIFMKYPSIDILKKIDRMESGDKEIDVVFDIIAECVDYIYDSEEVYNAKDQTKEEIVDFMNNLTSEQFARIESFFNTMPKLAATVEYDCPVCGRFHRKTLEGLNSFF